MKKLFLIPLFVSLLNAQSFETFLDEALQNSPYLKANAMRMVQAKESASLTTRYKNPTLSLEASNFSPDTQKSEIGYRAALSQPIRLWGVSDDRSALAEVQRVEAKSLVSLNRANFVGALSLLYIEYKSRINREKLLQEELLISQKIALISKERYESGTIAKVKFIQAKLDTARVNNTLNERRVETISAYYRLLGLAGVNEEKELEVTFSFTISSVNDVENSAEIAYVKNRAATASASAELNANKLEWINLYGEFEQEPDQSIARVGVDIPLVIFNTKSQEKKIAKIKAKRVSLIAINISNARVMQLKELERSLAILESLSESTEALLSSQQELLNMYEDGYKVANIDLIELQMIKNQMIATREKAISIKREQEQKIVEHNLLTGEYND